MRRRDFLSGLALAPGLAAARLPQTAAAPPVPHGMKLGTVTYNIAKDWDIPTIIKNLTESRLEGVALRQTHAHKVELSLTANDRRDVRKRFEDGGIEIAGLGTTCEYQAADKSVV